MNARTLDLDDPPWIEREAGLASLAHRAVSSTAVESTIAYALDLLRLHTGAPSATYWDMPDPGHLRLAIALGWPQAVDGTAYAIAPDSQAAYVLGRDQVVLVDQHADTRFVPSRLVAAMGFASTMTRRLGTSGVQRGLISIHGAEGDAFDPADAPLLDAVAGIVTLALEYHRSQVDLRFRAEHDSLTGLANRARLVEGLDSVAGRSPAASILLLDLDGFKNINDSSGHHVGDAVLQGVSARLIEHTRSGDLVGRLGGDEFVVIAHNCDLGRARGLAERIIGAVEQLITVEHETFSISASVGIADASRHRCGLDALRAADAAMYEAKLSGRGRVLVASSASPLQQAPSRDRASTAGGEPAGAREGSALTVADIDAAIACTTVVFQPIVDADSREIVGVEALARGPVGTQFEQPAVFFAAAETFSRINELELAAKRAAFASGVPDSLALFVNVDPAVLADDRCRSELIEAWRASGFAGDVVVELTERALVASPGRLLRAIDSCREVGWRVALDDLGARAESLTALRLVRPDVAKLDLSLVDGRNRSHAASVAVAVATHRERWPLVVVAEGVETAADEDTARDLGATLLQGFRFGRPATLQDVLAAGAPDTARRAGEWFDPSPIRTTRRVATKRHLLEVTRVVEAMASGPESIVLAAIQSSTYYTRRTRSQYAALARCCGMAGVIGGGIPPGVVRGVHHAPLADDDPLIGEWIVVVLAANGGVALAASDIGHRGGDDLDRLFEYHVTREPGEVESIAHRLLAYF